MPTSPPRKFLNLEALKCQFWISNTTISVKNLGNLVTIFAVFFKTNFSVGSQVKYSAFCFLLCEFDENITTRVKIRIFPILITYWLGLRSFK